MKSTLSRVAGGLAAGIIAVSITLAGAGTASAATTSASTAPVTAQNSAPDPLPFLQFATGVVDGLTAPVFGILNGPFN